MEKVAVEFTTTTNIWTIDCLIYCKHKDYVGAIFVVYQSLPNTYIVQLHKDGITNYDGCGDWYDLKTTYQQDTRITRFIYDGRFNVNYCRWRFNYCDTVRPIILFIQCERKFRTRAFQLVPKEIVTHICKLIWATRFDPSWENKGIRRSNRIKKKPKF